MHKCIGGVITYCAGPNDRAKIDCASLGFSGCHTDSSVRNAWCVE